MFLFKMISQWILEIMSLYHDTVITFNYILPIPVFLTHHVFLVVTSVHSTMMLS